MRFASCVAFAWLSFCPRATATSQQNPQPMARIVVSVQRQLCPIRAADSAYAMWRAVHGRYQPAIARLPSTAVLSRDGGWAKGTVYFEALGTFERADSLVAQTDGVRNGLASVLAGNGRPVAERSRFARDGYATRIPDDEPRLLYQPDYFNWYYARLDGLLVDHWVDSAFAARHDLAIDTTSNGSSITFCGRDHSRPWIEGTMDVTRDSLLSHVAFRYVTPAPLEHAAGEIWFDVVKATDLSARHLWPVRTIFYRQGSPADTWYQEAWINLIWCAWNSSEWMRAGKEPDVSSASRGCTRTNPR